MTKAATHSGTCQICGRDQKLPGGRLSKHGYTTRWGFFEGVCPGAHGVPFEKGFDLIEDAIASAKDRKAHTEALLEELKTETSFVWVRVTRRENTGLKKYNGREIVHTSEPYWQKVDAEALTVELNEDGTVEKAQFVQADETNERTGAVTKYHSADLVTWKTEDQDLNALIVGHNQAKRDEYAALIQNLEEYIAWQTERVENWTEQELTPVGPSYTLHFKAERFRRDSAACVGSAMAAQRFNGVTTEDESKVTCKKCLKRIADDKAYFEKRAKGL